MLQFFVYCLFLSICCAQDDLTYLRTEEIRLIQEQLTSLTQQMKAIETKNADMGQILMRSTSASYTPLNGYLYEHKYVHPANLAKAQQVCARLGGDVAIHGMKTLEERRNILRSFRIIDICIGLKYNATESNWVWLNGEPANISEILWAPGQPKMTRNDFFGSGEEDFDFSNNQDYCVAIHSSDDPLQNGRAFIKFDERFSNSRFYLCEWEY